MANWVEKSGGLPKFIKDMAKHIHAKHPEWDMSRCYAVAVAATKRMAATGDTNFKGVQQVGAKARARSSEAAAAWEALKAKNAVRKKAK